MRPLYGDAPPPERPADSSEVEALRRQVADLMERVAVLEARERVLDALSAIAQENDMGYPK